MQARGDIGATKKRISESEKRIDTVLGDYVKKQYWCALLCFRARVHDLGDASLLITVIKLCISTLMEKDMTSLRKGQEGMLACPSSRW